MGISSFPGFKGVPDAARSPADHLIEGPGGPSGVEPAELQVAGSSEHVLLTS